MTSPSETIAKTGAQTPMAEHIERARAYMARGARMTLDAIHNDGSMSRYGFGPDVTLAISELLSLALQLEAMKREMAEKDAEASWHPITTCPIREPVDLWCVYGGEEYAQYDGGASIGKLVPNRHKSEEYGFFGNQSNDGVPQGHARDLIPVAWRKAVPQCPSELIAEVLGIPRTIDDARALIGGDDA